jgi:hypothetical protein
MWVWVWVCVYVHIRIHIQPFKFQSSESTQVKDALASSNHLHFGPMGRDAGSCLGDGAGTKYVRRRWQFAGRWTFGSRSPVGPPSAGVVGQWVLSSA